MFENVIFLCGQLRSCCHIALSNGAVKNWILNAREDSVPSLEQRQIHCRERRAIEKGEEVLACGGKAASSSMHSRVSSRRRSIKQ